MSVKFIWKGNTDTEDGIAIYRTETNTFELHLPSMQRARQIEQALSDVYTEGHRRGHREMIHAVTTALNETARKL